jgi:hypothetical protein
MSVDVVRRRFTVDEYLQMVQAGILNEDDRVELLDGERIGRTNVPGDYPSPPSAGSAGEGIRTARSLA